MGPLALPETIREAHAASTELAKAVGAPQAHLYSTLRNSAPRGLPCCFQAQGARPAPQAGPARWLTSCCKCHAPHAAQPA
eukprot:5169452-Lingulodinium_polyedra.AAC.1